MTQGIDEPLDLSDVYEPSGDSDELRLYKAKVYKVGTEMAERHRWCDAWKDALPKLGIKEEKSIRIETHVSDGSFLDFERTLHMLPSQLAGLTLEKQRSAVASQVGSIEIYSTTGPHNRLKSIKVKPEWIASFVRYTPPPPPTGMIPLPEDYFWAYKNVDGRSLHAYTERNTTEVVYAACSYEANSYTNWIELPGSRDMTGKEHKMCRKCHKWAERQAAQA